MPAVNEKQATIFRMALAAKEGKLKKGYSPKAQKIAKSLTASTIKEFTHEKQ